MSDDFTKAFAAHVVPSPTAVLPGTVLACGDATGTTYIHAFGTTTTAPAAPALRQDAVFLIYSATKLVTAIAALQCAERGLFSLDDAGDVERWLPELCAQPLLTGFDAQSGAPITAPKQANPTLRQLLMHVSGVAFDFINPKMREWTRAMGRVSNYFVTRGLIETGSHPFAFEPGAEFGYGAGNDWAGLMVARASGAASLGAYTQAHIFAPLGMRDSTFEPAAVPGYVERIVPRAARVDGVLTDVAGAEWLPGATRPKEHLGGTNLFSTVPDYMKLLVALLRNDGTLMSPGMLEELFRPQLSGAALASARAFLQRAIRPVVLTSCSGETDVNYAAGGMVLPEGVEGKFGRGTLHFGGASGWCWHVDRELGKVSLIGVNLWSGADEPSEDAKGEFFRFAHDRIAAARAT